jgi:peptidoglycan/LPS O-acetylase OafA/YrhL
MGGILAYKLSSWRRLALPAWLSPVILALLTSLFLVSPSRERAWWCCLALGVIIPQFQEIENSSIRWCSRMVARYSYGVYLTHFIFIWLAFDRLSFLALPLQIAVFATTATAIPILLYHSLEEPMMLWGRRLSSTSNRIAPAKPNEYSLSG